VARQQQIATIGQAVLVTAFVALGCLGIGSSLAPVKPAAQPQRERREMETDDRAIFAHQRVLEQRLALRRAPHDPVRHLKFARACSGRALVQVATEYSDAFPGALADDQLPATHYEEWRRAWYARDPHGDLRRAIHHARRALQRNPSPSTRISALELLAAVHYQRAHFAAAIGPLRQLQKLTPGCASVRFRLDEACRAVTRSSISRIRSIDGAADAATAPRL
jgi:hypothetical protein